MKQIIIKSLSLMLSVLKSNNICRGYVPVILALLLLASSAGAEPFAYIPNLHSNNVSVIDTATNTVTATVNVGFAPYGAAVNPAGTRVYVTNHVSNTVSVIDTVTNTVTATVPVGSGPTGVAVNPAGTRVYVVNYYGNTVSVINTATNTVIATLNVGSNPFDVAVNPADTHVYVTNTISNTVSVINTTTNMVTATVNVGSNPSGVAVNSAGTRVYVATRHNVGTVYVIDTATNTVTTTVTLGSTPISVAVNPAGTRAYVTMYNDGTVTVIDTATNTVIATVNVGSNPFGVAVNPAGTHAYVANQGSKNVSVIDTATNTVTATVNVGIGPYALGQFIGPADTTPPSIEIITPSNGASYILNQHVASEYNCNDPYSGVDTCIGTVANGDYIDTTIVGSKSFTVTATDYAGNTASLTNNYNVIYNFAGFFSPVDNIPTLNAAKAGQAIPLKWRLLDANNIPVTNLASVDVKAVSLTCPLGDTPDQIEEYSAGSSGLQYLGDGYYQFNWNTPKTYAMSCKTLNLDLGDNMPQKVLFAFKK